jgi:hypothetical protein
MDGETGAWYRLWSIVYRQRKLVAYFRCAGLAHIEAISAIIYYSCLIMRMLYACHLQMAMHIAYLVAFSVQSL